jgi:signal transduction histidine kinase
MQEQNFRELAGIAYYEVRSPLSSMIGYADLMLQGTFGPINADQHDVIQTMRRNGHRCFTLLHDLYEVILLRAGETQLLYEEIDISVLFDEVLDRYADYLDKAGARLVVHRAKTDLLAHAARKYLELLLGQLFQDMPNGSAEAVEIHLSRQAGSVCIDIQAGYQQENQTHMWPQPVVAFMVRSILEAHGGAMVGGLNRNFQMLIPASAKPNR